MQQLKLNTHAKKERIIKTDDSRNEPSSLKSHLLVDSVDDGPAQRALGRGPGLEDDGGAVGAQRVVPAVPQPHLLGVVETDNAAGGGAVLLVPVASEGGSRPPDVVQEAAVQSGAAVAHHRGADLVADVEEDARAE